jgi:hypothetical protein
MRRRPAWPASGPPRREPCPHHPPSPGPPTGPVLRDRDLVPVPASRLRALAPGRPFGLRDLPVTVPLRNTRTHWPGGRAAVRPWRRRTGALAGKGRRHQICAWIRRDRRGALTGSSATRPSATSRTFWDACSGTSMLRRVHPDPSIGRAEASGEAADLRSRARPPTPSHALLVGSDSRFTLDSPGRCL